MLELNLRVEIVLNDAPKQEGGVFCDALERDELKHFLVKRGVDRPTTYLPPY